MIRAAPWLSGGIFFLALWFGALHAPFSTAPAIKIVVLLSPFVIILFLGIISLSYVMYGVLTFNDCTGEDEKLQKQIDEARRALKDVGYQF